MLGCLVDVSEGFRDPTVCSTSFYMPPTLGLLNVLKPDWTEPNFGKWRSGADSEPFWDDVRQEANRSSPFPGCWRLLKPGSKLRCHGQNPGVLMIVVLCLVVNYPRSSFWWLSSPQWNLRGRLAPTEIPLTKPGLFHPPTRWTWDEAPSVNLS